jgi:hypothetical protein
MAALKTEGNGVFTETAGGRQRHLVCASACNDARACGRRTTGEIEKDTDSSLQMIGIRFGISSVGSPPANVKAIPYGREKSSAFRAGRGREALK